MKVGILGSGAIGGFIGGLLKADSSSNVQVLFFSQSRFINSCSQHEMTISSSILRKDFKINKENLSITQDLKELITCDVILICLKSQLTETIGTDLAKVLQANPLQKSLLLISFQNGIRNPSILRAVLKETSPFIEILAGMVAFNVVWDIEANVFQQTTSGGLFIEKSKTNIEKEISTALKKTGLSVVVSGNLPNILYGKLLVNLMNPINALSGLTMGETLSNREYRLIWSACMDEGLFIYRSAGINPAGVLRLPVSMKVVSFILKQPNFIYNIIQKSQKITGKGYFSMAQDIRNGQKTEIDFINGEIVTLARSLGLSAPLNQKIVELIKQVELLPVGTFKGYSSKELKAKLSMPENDTNDLKQFILFLVFLCFSYIILIFIQK